MKINIDLVNSFMRIMVFVNCDLIRAPCADRCNMETLRSRLRIVRRYHWPLCALAWACIAASAQATMTKIKFQPNSADINDLGHHLINTWRIDDISLSGLAVMGATLSVSNISIWDANPNVRHSHLLDTTINPGVASVLDDPTGSPPVTNLADAFVNVRYHSDSKWPTQAATADMFLANTTFTATAVDDAFDSATSQLQTLATYIADGSDIALGLDPDHHFFNDGIKFAMTLTPVPEMEAIYPIVSLFAAIVFTRILQRRRAAQLKAGASAER